MQITIFFQLDRLCFVNIQPGETKAAVRKDNITDVFKRLENFKQFAVCERTRFVFLSSCAAVFVYTRPGFSNVIEETHSGMRLKGIGKRNRRGIQTEHNITFEVKAVKLEKCPDVCQKR